MLGSPDRRYARCSFSLWGVHFVFKVARDQTFSFPCLSERISLFKLFEIGFLVVFGDLEGLFCAENENFPV